MGYQPVNAIIGLVSVSIIFGLLCLIDSVAAQALFSLFVASNYVAWGVPIACRLIWGEKRFQPGEFYTGKMSRPIAIVAVLWLMFGLVLSMFPSNGPNPSRKSLHLFILFVYFFIFLFCKVDADLCSGRNELHDRNQWLRLVGQYDILCAIRAEVVHGPEDDGEYRPDQRAKGAYRIV